MSSICKYQDALKKCGYISFEFVPIRIGHLVEFYEREDMFLKASSYNVNSKGFYHEYKMLKLVYDQQKDLAPEPISYGEYNGIQILCMRKILGEDLSFKNYNSGIATKIKRALHDIFNIKMVHGDIKKDNIMIARDESIRILDFELSSIVKGMADFESSPDIIGNEGRNFTNLIRTIERE
jgi:serine/threonine protein kinase